MILTLSLFACTDPEALAVSACQAVPTLSPDAASLEVLRPLISSKELAAVEGAEPTEGQKRVGAEGLAELRSKASCSVESVEGAGSGAWAVSLKRTLPEVLADGSFGDPIEAEFTWQVSTAEGGRAMPGLVTAAAMRRSIAEAREQDDLRRAVSTTGTLSRSFPDPTLSVDVALAEAELAEAEALQEAEKAAKLAEAEAAE